MKDAKRATWTTHWLRLGLIVIGALLFVGCNTMQGAGEDIKDAGEAVQDAAD